MVNYLVNITWKVPVIFNQTLLSVSDVLLVYVNASSPTPQGLVQRFKANGIKCERVKTCKHLCIHIYMCIYTYIYIQVHKKSRHGKHLYIYLNIHTQANSCTPGKVYGRVYIYIYMYVDNKF